MRRHGIINMTEYIKEAFSLLISGNSELWGIIKVTLQMSFFSTVISSFLGLPLGTVIGRTEFKGKGLILRITNTLMGLPPVVAGLVVFLTLSRSGPLGSLKLLFSVAAMVIAQVVLITPLMTGMSASASSEKAPKLRETASGLRMGKTKEIILLMLECRPQFVSIILLGFGRAIAEVGAVSLVGGNIQFKTRVMTTAIMLETNKGNFRFAVALGIVLLAISFIVNSIAYTAGEKRK